MTKVALQINSLSKSYGVDLILENINMNINDNEKVGLIGVNGAGKTTLLRVISGELSYDTGSIYTPKGAKLGFLKQNAISDSDNTMWEEIMSVFSYLTDMELQIRSLEEKMSDDLTDDEKSSYIQTYSNLTNIFETKGGFEIETKIKTVINGMGFGSFDLKNTKVSTLSGGEKTKFAFSKLLLEAPDVLLLDEPTNHLDFSSMQWLESYLKSYKGIIITVSHDRYFLDSICDTIYEIENTKATKYTGNYSKYLEEKKKNYEIELKHYIETQEEIKRLEEYVSKNKARASSAKMAKSKQKAIDRIEVKEKPQMYKKQCNFKFELDYPSYKDVLLCENLSLKINVKNEFKEIVKGINLDVKRGEKVAIIGANGIGKSTLLKTLSGENKFYSGDFEFGRNVSLSYYDQSQKLLHDDSTVLNEIWDRFPRMDEVEVRNHLAGVLFTNDDVFKKVSLLSGGERARLMLLVIMMENANTLLLDEPTNHLDLSSKEALDLATKNFEGTLIMVSHDRYFLNKCADRILELTKDGITSYNGNYDEYLSQKNSLENQDTFIGQKQTQTSAQLYEENKRKSANIKNLTKKLEKLENEISQTEFKISEIKEKISQTGSDYDKAYSLFEESNKYEEILNDLYEKWDEISKELELYS